MKSGTIARKKNRMHMPVLALVTVFMLACDIDVPIKEMSQAKSTITRAIEVKAENYAPDELKQAKERLMNSHGLVMDNEIKKAKEEVDLSLKAGLAAIEKSLPLLAKDELDETKKIYAEAEQLDAPRSAPEEFSRAGAAIKEAESLAGEKKYWESYLKAKDAAMPCREARDKALASIPTLEKEIERISQETETLKKNRGNEFAAQDIVAVGSDLGDAKTLIQNKTMKEAFAKVKDADAMLTSAKNKTGQGVAIEKLDKAEADLKKISESEFKNDFSADIAKAADLVAKGREDLTAKSFDASSQKADEAIALIAATGTAIEKKKGDIKAEEEKTKQAELDRKKAEEEARRAEESKTTDKKEKTDLQPAVQGSEYVVVYNPQSRDCLWKIAQNVYKDPMMWPIIYLANKDQIKDPDLIFPGQKFIIPPIPKKEEPKKEELKKEEPKKVDEKPNEEKKDTKETKETSETKDKKVE
jgi:nucleoid-associated protein YgaU